MSQSRNKREGWPSGKSMCMWDTLPGQPTGAPAKLIFKVGKYSRSKNPFLQLRNRVKIDWS